MADWPRVRVVGNRRFTATRWVQNMRNHYRTAFSWIVRSNFWKGLPILSMALFCKHPVQADESAAVELSFFDDCRQTVLDYNEQLQMGVLQTEASEQRLKGAKSIFDPEFVSVDRFKGRVRPNPLQQVRALSNLAQFDQENFVASSSIDSSTKGGGKVRLGHILTRSDNKLQGAPSMFGGATSLVGEYVGSGGIDRSIVIQGCFGASIKVAASPASVCSKCYLAM